MNQPQTTTIEQPLGPPNPYAVEGPLPFQPPTLAQWGALGVYPRLTNNLYEHNGLAFSQNSIAACARMLALAYERYSVDDYVAEEQIRYAALQSGVTVAMARTVAEWMGLYINAAHDTDPTTHGYTDWNTGDEIGLSWFHALEWAYDMLT